MKKVAIQGIRGSFHDEASRMYFGDEIMLVECGSFKSALDTLAQGKADYCVMAIENSIAGSILSNFSLLSDYHFKAIGEVYLNIQLHLLALEETEIGDVKNIMSHPMAIKQCADFLLKFPHAKILELYDTAECAKQVSEKKVADTVVIANEESGKIYGLRTLYRNIETHKKNYTRFFVLANENFKTDENNKASISFQVADKPGALSKVLNVFNENSINLSRIQSVPIIGKPNEYRIHTYIEWEWSGNYRKAMADAIHLVSNLSILGEYKSGKIPNN